MRVLRETAGAVKGSLIRTRLEWYERRAQRAIRHIRRRTQDSCWCGNPALVQEWVRSFSACTSCGSWVNRIPPVDLAELYSLDLYWKRRQRLRGAPPIEQRGDLYRQDGRLRKWLDLVDRYGPRSGAVVEVGCAPGVLLQELSAAGYDCVGVEISDDVAGWMRDRLNLDVRSGFFPGVELPPCDLFCSFDTLEHSPDPEEFVREAARLLRPGGVAIIQTAIDRYGTTPIFGDRFADMFDDVEHLFLFTDEAMRMLADRARLEVVSLDERIWIAGEVAVYRKPVT